MKFSFKAKLTSLFFICLLLRLFFAGQYLDNEDSINFAMGLHDYDLSLLQPHFPGYPVYIFLSSLFFTLFHNDVAALVMPGVFFSSLTIFPLSFLTRRLFTEKTAILTAVLYIVNPLCWIQSERPASDSTGVFFIILSAQFFFSAFSIAGYKTYPLGHKKITSVSQSFPFGKKEVNSYGGYYLFLGSLFLGIGLGVRLSYFPFIFLWLGTLSYYAFHRIHLEANCIFSGVAGLFAGTGLWFIPQIYNTGLGPFFYHALFFTKGHFTDWGGSVFTFGGWERVLCFLRSFWEYGLGAWRHKFSYFSGIPPIIITLSVYFAFRYFPSGSKRFFCVLYAIPYTLWIIFGQNAAHPRHLLPLLPLILMCVAFGLWKLYEVWGKKLFMIFAASLIVFTSTRSFTTVLQYRRSIPAPTQLLQYVETHYKNTSARIYCGPEEKRFFDYYLPQWDVRCIRDVADIHFDLQSSLMNPETILIVWKGKKIPQPDARFSRIIAFEGYPHVSCLDEDISLYKLQK
ncbi:MAG: glycosyltransferase family 39 protein [Candidatus Kuenenia sp.]|nr:glycosyltransferase family 39 protein [Candidatus Kuenenia hertensis]